MQCERVWATNQYEEGCESVHKESVEYRKTPADSKRENFGEKGTFQREYKYLTAYGTHVAALRNRSPTY